MKFLILIALIGACVCLPRAVEDDVPVQYEAQECIDLKNECIALSTDILERTQCYVQFGLCMGGKLMGCYKKCFPALKICKRDAGASWEKNFKCFAGYVNCVIKDCH